MKVRNVHERFLPHPAARVGALIDTLASADDRLWPRELWPAMRFDRPIGVGARGGHGPIRYFVEAYAPSESIVFRFTRPRGFDGIHRIELAPAAGGTIIRHVLEMETSISANAKWRIVFEPLHDALIEDAFDCADLALGDLERQSTWSPRVRALRWLVSRGRRRRDRGSRSRASDTSSETRS